MTQHPDLGPVAGPVAGAGAGAGADARPGRFAARGRREAVELTLAVVVVLATSVHLLRFVRIAWYVSLWNDEVWSVVRYSGHGPIHVVTHYGSANNHVFFNLVNALTPGAGSADPARARWWSIVAVLAMQVIVLVVFWRRRWYLAGAVLFGLFATSPEWLDLTLQARGYGFLGLAALLSCTTLWRYLEVPRHGSLAGLGLVTVAGAWTVPSYLLFAAPLWLLLLVVVRRRAVLVAGVVTAAGVVAVYLPILSELRLEMSTYEEQWGRSYTSLGDVADTIGIFLLRPSLFGGHALGTALTVAVLVLAVLGAAVLPLAPTLRSLVLVLVGSSAVFFAANLWLGTAVLRTTAFVTVPVGFALVVLVAGVLEQASAGDELPGGPVGAGLVSVVALAVVAMLTVQGIGRPEGAFYLPLQDWQGVARYVDRTFPSGTRVASTGDPAALLRVTAYLDGSHPEDGADPLGSEEVAAGRTVLIDLAKSGEPSFDFGQVASVWSEARFPQRIGRYMRVLAAAPEDPHLSGVLVDGRAVDVGPLTDRRRSSGITLPHSATTVRIVPPPGQVTRSVVLVADTALRPVRSVAVVVEGRAEPIPWDEVSWYGPSLTLEVGDRRIEALEVVFKALGADGDRDGGADLREVWTYPGG